MRLYEKYRPTTLADVIGQPKAVKTIRHLAEHNGIGGQSFWLAEKSGTGKTTLARILAAYLADDFFVIEFPGRELTPRHVRRLQQDSRLYSLGKGGRVWIINEAHGMSKPVIEMMLDWLEALPDHVAVIFTTTRTGRDQLFDDQIDAHPLLSRCIQIPLTCQGLAPAFARRTLEIATEAGLNGKPLSAYVRLANECNGNFRMMLEAVQAGKMLE
ncbi:MAG: AAA family ATPase [Phycisphaerae bacterium]|nr:AAA family ATPase [Phycisphaerae bacterium]